MFAPIMGSSSKPVTVACPIMSVVIPPHTSCCSSLYWSKSQTKLSEKTVVVVICVVAVVEVDVVEVVVVEVVVVMALVVVVVGGTFGNKYLIIIYFYLIFHIYSPTKP